MKYYSIGQFAKLIGYCRVSSNKQKDDKGVDGSIMEKKMELRMRREVRDILIHHVGEGEHSKANTWDLLEDILGVFTNEVRTIDQYCEDKVIEARRIKVDELEQIRAEENGELLKQLKYYKGKVIELQEHIQEDKTINTLKPKVTKLDNKVKVLKKIAQYFCG